MARASLKNSPGATHVDTMDAMDEMDYEAMQPKEIPRYSVKTVVRTKSDLG